MHKFLRYTALLLTMVILQVFLFSRVGISVYVHPLVYIAFVILLPMEIKGVSLLLLAFALGVSVDFFTGTPGINTIASVFTAFCRPTLLYLFAGKDEVKDGGTPDSSRLGVKKFTYYMCSMVLLQNIVYFSFEAMAWEYFYLVMLRIVISSAVSAAIIYLIQKLFFVNPLRKL